MTPDQWKQLAGFAGVEYTGEGYIRFPISGGHYWNKPWSPLTDWSDFGPLWMLLEEWMHGDEPAADPDLISAIGVFEMARVSLPSGTVDEKRKRLMQAGCLLGAAIGATMNNPARPEIERK